MGGDNYQLMMLSTFNHSIDYLIESFIVKDNNITWGYDFLCNLSRKQIRNILNQKFSSIEENNKEQTTVLLDLARSKSILSVVRKYSSNYPEIIKLVDNSDYQNIARLSTHNQLIIGFILCQELAAKLDVNDLTSIKLTVSNLNYLSEYIILLAVRKYITLERIIKFNLDKDPNWETLLLRVNKIKELFLSS